MSRTTYTPFDCTTNEMSAAVIVMEYTAPLSMMTRRTGVKILFERYCADLRATLQILNARRAAKGEGVRASVRHESRAWHVHVDDKFVARDKA